MFGAVALFVISLVATVTTILDGAGLETILGCGLTLIASTILMVGMGIIDEMRK